MKKTIAINFYGGPGTGKSSMAAAIFSNLKNEGINAELVTEYAKSKGRGFQSLRMSSLCLC